MVDVLEGSDLCGLRRNNVVTCGSRVTTVEQDMRAVMNAENGGSLEGRRDEEVMAVDQPLHHVTGRKLLETRSAALGICLLLRSIHPLSS